MTESNVENMEKIQQIVKEGRIDDAVKEIGKYLNESTEENYIERMENIIETILRELAGKTVLRFLIEHVIIDIPYLLNNLSKKDSLLRYSFLLILKTMCENEADLFLPYTEELLNSEDPNVREAQLQLLIFIEGGDKDIEDEELLLNITKRLNDEKEFVANKAIQLLKIIGKETPSLITKILTSFLKEYPDNEVLMENIDNVLKSIVTAEKIDEIIEEEGESEVITKAKTEKEKEKKVDLGINKEEVMEKKEKMQVSKDLTQESEEFLSGEKIKEAAIEKKQSEISRKTIELAQKEKKVIEETEERIKEEELAREEKEIKYKKLELKKKELELKKKELELEAKEKELEEKKLEEKEKALRQKEELLEKETMLSQVELELKQKAIEEKEKKIKEEEKKRNLQRLEEVEK